MKKLDKLIINSFIGPFILTFLVVVFILLMQHMLRYFDDIIGKDLGYEVISKLLFYFAIFMVPVAMPLAVLLSSLITFGNLGEHFELTAIKASGISLLRTLQPIFFFVLLLTGFAFYVNNNLVPKAALEAYSLLYDIKQKKPALDLREGTFYNGIPDISIKVDKKFSDDAAALKGIVVYDHRRNDGNKEVTKADSGRMYTILNERYLKFELFNGYNYTEGGTEEQAMAGKKGEGRKDNETLTRSRFYKTEVVFDLSSFDLQQTDKKWFQGNRIMRNLSELDDDIDSIYNEVLQTTLNHHLNKTYFFTHLHKNVDINLSDELKRFKAKRDSIERRKYISDSTLKEVQTRQSVDDAKRSSEAFKARQLKRLRDSKKSKNAGLSSGAVDSLKVKIAFSDSIKVAKIDSLIDAPFTADLVQAANNRARQAKNNLMNNNASIDTYQKEMWVFQIQWHKILASSMACIAMFLIGAPLGAIIKKGGLGVPFLVSIFFFIIYYLLSMQGEKAAKQGVVSAAAGIWAADLILLFVGLLFLRQARIDARLFDADFYRVVLDKLKKWLASKRQLTPNAIS
jgi:lipopolysaccharide export system permease protein